MKYLYWISLSFLVACSSGKVKVPPPVKEIPSTAFHKERPLKKGEVPDFYVQATRTLNPALQDETLDRHADQELKAMQASDPLVEMSLLCSKKEFKAAFDTASRAYDRYQKIAAYWNLIGNCHLNQGSQRKALLFYNKALEVAPNYAPALNNIGVMYSRQGLDQKALVAFERAFKQSKFSKTPRYNLAKLYLSYGLAELALPLFQGLLEGAPSDADILNAMASTYFLLSDYQKALSYYQRIPRELWSQAEIGLNMALTLNKLGRAQEARQVFNGVDRPNSEKLRRYLEAIEKKLGDA